MIGATGITLGLNNALTHLTYSKIPIQRTVCMPVWQYIAMNCQTGPSYGTYNRKDRVASMA